MGESVMIMCYQLTFFNCIAIFVIPEIIHLKKLRYSSQQLI